MAPSASVGLKFSFVDGVTNVSVALKEFTISFLDFDMSTSTSGKECLTIAASQWSSYLVSDRFTKSSSWAETALRTSAGTTELDVDGTMYTSFCATEHSTLADDAASPVDMTDEQRRKSVAFSIVDKEAVELTLSIDGSSIRSPPASPAMACAASLHGLV